MSVLSDCLFICVYLSVCLFVGHPSSGHHPREIIRGSQVLAASGEGRSAGSTFGETFDSGRDLCLFDESYQCQQKGKL